MHKITEFHKETVRFEFISFFFAANKNHADVKLTKKNTFALTAVTFRLTRVVFMYTKKKNPAIFQCVKLMLFNCKCIFVSECSKFLISYHKLHVSIDKMCV